MIQHQLRRPRVGKSRCVAKKNLSYSGSEYKNEIEKVAGCCINAKRVKPQVENATRILALVCVCVRQHLTECTQNVPKTKKCPRGIYTDFDAFIFFT